VARIEVVPKPAGGPAATGGFGRRQAFETENVRVGETRVSPGAASPWHHHCTRTLYGFVVTGQLVLEFGRRGGETVRPSAGDFFRIPAGLVHRDVNPGEVETHVVSVILGEGPATVEVRGPEE
jgi:quercetin dioxygenase-like cupin family protein